MLKVIYNAIMPDAKRKPQEIIEVIAGVAAELMLKAPAVFLLMCFQIVISAADAAVERDSPVVAAEHGEPEGSGNADADDVDPFFNLQRG